MDRLRAIIVDDEELAREAIKELLEGEPEIQLVGECRDGIQAIEMIESKKPDMVFLDVQMPGADGFSVLEGLRDGKMPLVVFTTAYDQYALKAFEANAVDYLLKPIPQKRFREAIERARDVLAHRTTDLFAKRIFAVLDSLHGKGRFRERFVVKSRGRIILLKTDDLTWIEAAGDYVRLHIGSENHLFHGKISKLEKELDHRIFVRIHRSAIVNVDRIKELEPLFSGDYSMILHDGTKLTLSRTHRDKVLNILS